jgi:alpha-1,6-mannosyltransferase
VQQPAAPEPRQLPGPEKPDQQVNAPTAPREAGAGREAPLEVSANGVLPTRVERAPDGRRWQTQGAAWLAALRALACSARASLFGLGIAGLLLEAVLVLGWSGAFSLSGHRGFPAPGQDPLVWLLGGGPGGLDHFVILLGAAFGPYFLALWFGERLEGAAGLLLAAAGALAFGVTALGLFPAGATDIFYNIVDARLMWLYHLNPMTVPPAAIGTDPLFDYLHYWQGTTSTYGPLWSLLTLPAVIAGGSSLTRNIIAFKALPFAFELASLILIVLIVRRIDARRTVAAAVFFGWNPLVLWEFAGNGHNDIVMMTFVLLALLLALTHYWPFALPALAASVLVKYISLVLLPPLVLWLLYRHGRAAVRPLLAGLGVSLVLGVILFAPFWAGPRTLASLSNKENQVFLSPASALMGAWGEDVPRTAEVVRVERGLEAAFVLFYLVALTRIRRDPATLFRAGAGIMAALIFLLAWWFWPWYLVWGLVLAALVPASRQARMFILFSATSMLVYCSSAWRLTLWNFDSDFPMALGTALLAFAPPLLYVAIELTRGPADRPLPADSRALIGSPAMRSSDQEEGPAA